MSKQRSFRDFTYDHSDIIVAAIILVIALFLILWRVQIIMDYPSTLSQAIETTNTTSSQTANTNSDSNTTSQGTKKATWDGENLADDFSFKITGSSEADRIQSLIDAGLFTSSVDVENVCKENEVKAADVKTGEYSLTKGMTKRDILLTIIK